MSRKPKAGEVWCNASGVLFVIEFEPSDLHPYYEITAGDLDGDDYFYDSSLFGSGFEYVGQL